MIYLDTHVALWLYEGLLERFPSFAKKQLEDNDLAISPIVQLELEYLYEIKKITCSSKLIIDELITRISLSIADNSFEKIIQQAARLSWARDPFDRIIVATAELTNSLLLTKDSQIAKNYRHAVWD